MQNIDSQEDIFFKNSRVFQIRDYLKLEQQGFAEALGVHQSMISYIEKNKKKVSNKTKSLICKVFFVDPLFFDDREDVGMFLEGREKDALQIAEDFRSHKSNVPSKKAFGVTAGGGADLQAVVIEKLTAELELTKQLLNSKEDLVLVLKEQLNAMNSNYANLSQELAELKKMVSQDVVGKLNEITENISGERDNPNGANPVKRSG
ncbi:MULTISPECIES: helix-turn-helix domain-containing protein [Sphingobacterium]|uniref:helix-turn-helix domain-containing protein n=1 Tax=Sphingobacterium TaxID=28453 RepID=UPI0025806320|nr:MULTISPECIES: helix-turn-helix transcriptional regulator [Sphingobacterium]